MKKENILKRLTHDEFLNKISFRDDIEILSEYTLSNVKIRVKCKKCGLEFERTPNGLLCKKTKCPCPNCANVSRHDTMLSRSENTLDKIQFLIKELYPDNEYIFNLEESSYINNKSKTLSLKCSRCEKSFLISYSNLKKRRGCPFCNKINRQESKNIALIKKALKEKNIFFTEEYKIPECRDKRCLPFDIAVNISNKLYLIEYDGEQHDILENSVIRQHDDLKTKFCIDNNIPFLRLRYNDFDNYVERIYNFLNV